MRRLLILLVLVAVGAGAAAVLVASAAPAGASCAGEPSVARAVAAGGPMFVGTVISTTYRSIAQDPADVASAMTDKDANGGPSGLAIAGAVAGVAVLVVIALWLLFRRGSIGDRAKTDVPDPGDPGDPGSP